MLDITEEKAKAIFKYIASKLKCSDVRLSSHIRFSSIGVPDNVLMAKDIDSRLWFTVFLVNRNRGYDFINGNNYVSLLDRITKYKYVVINERKYKIPNSLEELLIETDLNYTP